VDQPTAFLGGSQRSSWIDGVLVESIVRPLNAYHDTAAERVAQSCAQAVAMPKTTKGGLVGGRLSRGQVLKLLVSRLDGDNVVSPHFCRTEISDPRDDFV